MKGLFFYILNDVNQLILKSLLYNTTSLHYKLLLDGTTSSKSLSLAITS